MAGGKRCVARLKWHLKGYGWREEVCSQIEVASRSGNEVGEYIPCSHKALHIQVGPSLL